MALSTEQEIEGSIQFDKERLLTLFEYAVLTVSFDVTLQYSFDVTL